jgi:probable selenium-dependent hydroxylase accessory protein YqeC
MVCFVGAGGKTSLMFKLAAELATSGQSVLTTTTTKIRTPTAKQSPHVILAASIPEIEKKTRKAIDQWIHISAASKEMPAEKGKLIGYPPGIVDELQQKSLAKWILVEADGAAGKPLKAPAEHEPVLPKNAHTVVAVIGLDSVGEPLDEKSVFRPELFSRISGIGMGATITAQAIVSALEDEQGLLKKCPPRAIKMLFLNKADTPKRLETGQKIARLITENRTSELTRILIGSARSAIPVIEYHDRP